MFLRSCSLLAAGLIAVSNLSSAPAELTVWPQFRGEDGNATATADPPVKWSADENIKWKTPLPGRGASSPIIWNDRIFLTAFTGYGLSGEDLGKKEDLKLHTLCISRADGKILWDKTIDGSLETQDYTERVGDHGFATGTPATDGERVYAYFGVSGLVAYDFEGKQLWQADLGSGTAGFGSASSPVVWGDHVYVNASIESDTLYALDKETGEIAWKQSPIVRSWSTPCIAELKDGSHELVLNQKDRVMGYDPKTGALLWTCDAIDDYIVPTPVFQDGIVYLLGGRGNRALAIRLGGRGDVTESHKLWQVNVGANVTSPVLYENKLFWASDRSIANCISAADGEMVYRERLPTSERIYASIVRAGDLLYVTTRDSGVIVLQAASEYQQLAQNKIESDPALLNAGPAVSGSQLFLRTDNALYCIEEAGK